MAPRLRGSCRIGPTFCSAISGLTPLSCLSDRSLVIVSALIASGQVAQITYHLGRAMDNGLTRGQASEVLTHIAFYAGWPNAFSALPVVKDVFESDRNHKRPRDREVRRMSSWRKDELKKIADTDDLHISPFREDGVTYGTPTCVWSVVVDDSLYLRAYNGTASRWYKAAMQQKRGRITAAGVTKNVASNLSTERSTMTLTKRIGKSTRTAHTFSR